MKDFAKMIKKNFALLLIDKGFNEYRKGRVYIKLRSNELLQYISFDMAKGDSSILVSFGIDCLFRKKLLDWSKKEIMQTIGSRIDYFTPNKPANRWFRIEGELDFLKSKKAINDIFSTYLFAWFDNHIAVPSILEAIKDPKLRQPDEGWYTFECIFLNLRLNNIREAKENINSIIKIYSYLPHEILNFCEYLIKELESNIPFNPQSFLNEIVKENVFNLKLSASFRSSSL